MRPQSYKPLSRPGASLLVVGAFLLSAHTAFAGGRANYVEVSSWDTGYQAQYTITNDGPGTLTTWTVAFDLPSGSSTSSSWDSVQSGSGQHLVFNNASWNGNLAAGSSTTFGFVVVGLGRPVGCRINGGPCDTLAPEPPPQPDPEAAAPELDAIRIRTEDVIRSFGELDRSTPSEQRRIPQGIAAARMPVVAFDPTAVEIEIAPRNRR